MGHFLNILLFIGASVVFGNKLADMWVAVDKQDMFNLIYSGFVCLFALLFAKFVFDLLPKYEPKNQEATSRTTEEN